MAAQAPQHGQPRDSPQSHRDTERVIDSINALTEQIIGAAIEVHRHLGPGLLESVYEEALAVELELRGIPFGRQVAVPLAYKGVALGEYRLDLLVDDAVAVEIKSVERHDPVFEAFIDLPATDRKESAS